MKNHYELFRVDVSYDGYVEWNPGGSFRSKCDIDVHLYPFDVQTCLLNFTNWMYTNGKVNLTINDTSETLEDDFSDGVWDVSETPTFVEPSESNTPSTVTFGLKLKRKPMYYVINVVAPTLCLSMLVLLVLRLPAESGEKISMGVTLLLSFAVYMLLVSDSVPVTSDSVPILGKALP